MNESIYIIVKGLSMAYLLWVIYLIRIPKPEVSDEWDVW